MIAIVDIALRELTWSLDGKGAARGTTERAGIVIEARTSDGLVGRGEASPLPGMSRETVDDARAALAAFAARAPLAVANTGSVADTSVVVSDTVGGTPTGHTWIQVGTYSAALVKVTMYYLRPTTVGMNHVVTWANSSTRHPAIAVFGCGGSADNPLEVFTGSFVNSGTTLSTGVLTPANNNDVVIAALGFQNSAMVTMMPRGKNSMTTTSNAPI